MKLLFAVALLLLSSALMAAFLLGIDPLDQDLPFGLNAGVAAAAASLIIAAIGPTLLTPDRKTTKTALMAAIAWLPVSIALAGGFQLSFSGWRSITWLAFTGFVLLAMLISWIVALVSYFRSRTAA